MAAERKRLVLGGIRLLLCTAALVLALRGVALHDSLVLRAGPTLTGTVTERAASFYVQPLHGVPRVVARSELAVSQNGAPQLAYGLRSIWRGSEKRFLLAGVAVFLLVPPLQVTRLKLMLSALHIRLGWRESVRLAFAGNFLNFAAPLGSTAGDVYKAWFAARRTPRKLEAAATVMLDRAIGLGTLLLSVGLIAACSGPESPPAPVVRAGIVPAAGVGDGGFPGDTGHVAAGRDGPHSARRRTAAHRRDGPRLTAA